MSRQERRARRLLRWYPRSWREHHPDEFLALLEDSISERPFWPRRTIDIAAHGLRVRSAELGSAFRTSRRRVLIGSSASLVVVVGALAVVTGGFGVLGTSGPTKGQMPYEPGKIVPYSSVPDYVAVSIGPNMIGYAPRAYETRNSPDLAAVLGRPVPIFASNLKTLLGHEYSGVGFVPAGKSPWSQPCDPESVIVARPSGETVITIPCPSTTIVLPNVVGMVTPTGMAELSRLGISEDVLNVHSRTVLPGHIVSTSPPAGTIVHARQVVVVDNSVR
ncbi:MAG TPA: PASTA domain-containing protein [Acidimicrobiales bacterium]